VVAPVVGLGVAVHGGALGYVATLALLQVVATGLAIGASRPQLLRRGDGPRLADALGFALPLVPQQAASLLLAIGDRVVVQRYLGSVATGRYSAAYAVGSLGVMVASALNQVWMTRIYRLGDGAADLAALDAARDRVLRLAAVVTVGVAAGAPLLYRLWLPGAFRGGQLDLVTSLVACSLLPFAAYGTNLWTALRLGASGRLAAATIVAAAVNLGLNVLLVPPLGLVGSALATLIGYGLLAVAASRWVIGPASRWSCRPRSWLAVAAAGAVAVGQSLVSGGTAVDVLRAALTAAAVVALLVVVHRGRAGRGTDWAISEVWARFGSTP
jgi:O-antigen/teichoic acid export membrane protein